MEFVIKGLVLCLIALAGVYHADAAPVTLTGGGTVADGTAISLTCSDATGVKFKKDAGADIATGAGGYTITAAVLSFTLSTTTAGSYTCSSTTGGTTISTGTVVAILTTTTTTTAATTAKAGSGAEGINGLPLVVMIFAVLVSFFLRH